MLVVTRLTFLKTSRNKLNFFSRFFGSRKKQRCFIDKGQELYRSEEEKQTLVQQLKEKARELGMGPVTITSAKPSQRLPKFLKWIEEGRHGEMHYLAREDRLERRRDLQKVLPGVQSIIVCSLFFWPGRRGFTAIREDPTRGDISCYAWGRDYHDIFCDKLQKLAEFALDKAGGQGKWYVDTGALMERDLGERSGLGFIGKNTMLIHPRLGSGFFLGEILTTLSLPVDSAPKKMVGCGKCRRCQASCPTGALDEDYRMDARKCISYLTIELKGSIPVELRPLMRNKIYGCDICQQVCPWNKFDWQESIGKSPLFGSPDPEVTTPKLIELIQMSEEDFRKRFEKTAIQRIGHSRLLRNVAVALGNSGDVTVLPVLKKLLNSGQDSLVAEHLKWAIDQLENSAQNDQNSSSLVTNSH
ncbi:iron-sulfur cluster-binding protein [Galdieria sulphuraria]|uniref:Iron-sulfur cluster-binding protein n=1 Tax=Galdieria sulphuraria TaxID=130081 RepID=M2Y309_GALSU|nr:iron-sulfur cluster-binding protein [Galdieria sulphuraria]EME30323.1 iron-sulfur cluster-binding protein [Galdieria sulphuraria]|eukprot:XP_005706843.1 iron-sulfur cluster-binding protein [Galdieria sulphuraria]